MSHFVSSLRNACAQTKSLNSFVCVLGRSGALLSFVEERRCSLLSSGLSKQEVAILAPLQASHLSLLLTALVSQTHTES